MTNADFWKQIDAVVSGGFSSEGLQKLDYYAELFINGRIVYKRFSPFEQHGCATGGATHVIASLLAGAESRSDRGVAPYGDDFKRELQCGAQQAECIERWARQTNCWTDCVDKTLSLSLGEKIAEGGEAKVYNHGATLIKTIGLDYFVQPILALDRISLHNAYFPETKLTVLGFGRRTTRLQTIWIIWASLSSTHTIGRMPHRTYTSAICMMKTYFKPPMAR